MKKWILAGGLLLAALLPATAQQYQTGIGLRMGAASGFSVKHFVDRNKAIEGILGLRYNGFIVTGMLEKQQPAFDVSRLDWYYGAGAHIGFWSSDRNDNPFFDDEDQMLVLGIDGIVGLEYVIREIPLSVSLDWKPIFNVIGHFGPRFDYAGFTVRYTLGYK